MKNVIKILEERGFVKQRTHQEELDRLLEQPAVAYCGLDPTADSLHVGHLLPLMLLAHLQRAGHRPIAVIGGGTAMIGDPSGKTEMRRMLTVEEIKANAGSLAAQVGRILDIGTGRGLVVNNADWLGGINYIEFLRDIGVHFSVNRMLTYECFKSRMEKGLSFIEFNYMLLQSYDYLMLYREHHCRLQVGGDDQWSNIISGADLIRRMEGAEAYGLTVPLLETAGGAKMGKTESGAVWIDPDKVPPYEFFQFWRNVHDDDVRRFMLLYTFLPVEEINALTAGTGKELNPAKEALAYQVTRMIHGEAAAQSAREAARALFAGAGDGGAIPTTSVSAAELSRGIPLLDLLLRCGLVASKSEGRRLVREGGIYLNEKRVTDFELTVTGAMLDDGKLMLRKGKKIWHQVVVV